MTRYEGSPLSPRALRRHLLIHRTIPLIAPLIAPIHARMGAEGSGAARVGSVSARTIPPSFQFELGEGSNRSIDTRNLGLWQYKSFCEKWRASVFGEARCTGSFSMDFISYWSIWKHDMSDRVPCPDYHRGFPG